MKKIVVVSGSLILVFAAVAWLVTWQRAAKRDAAVQDIHEQVAVIDREVQDLDFDWSAGCPPKDAALYADVLRRKGDAALAVSRARDLLGDDPRSSGLDRALGRIDDQLTAKRLPCQSAIGAIR
jgi:hypothetical protein